VYCKPLQLLQSYSIARPRERMQALQIFRYLIATCSRGGRELFNMSVDSPEPEIPERPTEPEFEEPIEPEPEEGEEVADKNLDLPA
jgi:hypothetical protein